MRVLGKALISEFSSSHADARDALAAWLYEAEEAEWKAPLDITERYPNSSILGGRRVVFNIKGNRYRLDAKIDFARALVIVVRIGTHAEYDKWEF